MSCQCNTMLCRIYLYPITSLVKISATTLIIFISRYNGPKMQWCTYLLCYNGISPCKAYPKYEGMTINSYLINLRKLSIEMECFSCDILYAITKTCCRPFLSLKCLDLEKCYS